MGHEDPHIEPSESEIGYRRRVVVKFQDFLTIPYDDVAKEHIQRLQIGPWESLVESFPGITLSRLLTVLDADEIQELVDRGTELDRTYHPPNLLTYFVVDCPPGCDAEALAETLNSWPSVETAYVESGPSPPPVTPADDPRFKNQGYLKKAPGGIDAEFAWKVEGGDGKGVQFIDIESGWMLTHEDLQTAQIQLIHGVNKTGKKLIDHGTAVLGVVVGCDNQKGGIGIAPEAKASVASEWQTSSSLDRANAILAAIKALQFGDVLLLEMQANLYPVETELALFSVIRLATALGIVVVEAAGNGYHDLDLFGPSSKYVLNRTNTTDFKDSGAIVVGAAVSTVPHSRDKYSNFGSRVDCYAWGENVDTAWCDSNGTKSLYTTEFAGTSSASAIIAGVALVVQGVAQAKLKRRFSAWQMRAILGDTTLGTPGALPPKAMVGDPGIGVMPDLKAVLSKALNVVPDVYLRDFVGDNGDPHAGAINASPDIILRTAKEANPKAAFGEGSATQNSNISSHKAKETQDNYVYVRVRNRGGAAAKGVVATIYHSEVSSLVTPLLWSKAGSIKLPDVPAGDLLTVSDPPITWPAAQIPKPGHYCFVALIGNAEDPAPVPADFMDWKTFRRLIRENNNVTWRNFQVVGNTPKPPVPPMPETDYVELPFLAPGAPDKDRRMALSISAQLPEGADCRLEAPTYLADALGAFSPEVRVFPDRDVAWLPLNPHGHTLIGEALFGQGSVHELKVLVDIPERYRRHAYELYVSQLYEGEEVGRITWRLAPER